MAMTFVEAAEALHQARLMAGAARRAEAQAKEALEAIFVSEGIEEKAEGRWRVRRATETQARFDQAAFKAYDPALYSEYVTVYEIKKWRLTEVAQVLLP